MAKHTGTESEMSMEEILDSIRQYVAEENNETAADPARLPHRESLVVPPPKAAEPSRQNPAFQMAQRTATDDVLELTEQFAAPERVPQPSVAQANMHLAKDAAGYAMQATNPHVQQQATVGYQQQRGNNPGSSQMPQAQQQPDKTSIGGASSVAQEFTRLSNEMQQQAERQLQANMSSQTLEQVVREMAQPLIKQWLAVNLPKITSKLVSEEIDRMRRTGTS